MAEILNILYVVAVVFLLFGAAIFVHEFGHFWVALKRGLKVEEFAIGFGPIIWSKTARGHFVFHPCHSGGRFCEAAADAHQRSDRGEA